MLIDISITVHGVLCCLCHGACMTAFLFLHFALLQNELCKVAPWEGVGIAHLIKEPVEINAPLLGAPAGALRRMHVQYAGVFCRV